MEFQAATLETKELENVFVEYAKATFGDKLEEDAVIAIDGKTECNSEFSRSREQGKARKQYIWYQHGRQGLESASVK